MDYREHKRRVKFQTDLARVAGITVEELVEELFNLCAEVAERIDADPGEIEKDIEEAIKEVREARALLAAMREEMIEEAIRARRELIREATRLVLDAYGEDLIDMGDCEYDPVAKIHFMKPKREEKMISIARCPNCGGYRMVPQPMKMEPTAGTADDCSSPCTCKPKDEEIERRRDIVKKMLEEYADYAKQQTRLCPYCGTALGIV